MFAHSAFRTYKNKLLEWKLEMKRKGDKLFME